MSDAEYYFYRAALAAVGVKAAEKIGDEYSRQRFQQEAVYFLAAGVAALAAMSKVSNPPRLSSNPL